MSQQVEKINSAIQKLKNKDFNIYFFCMDTRGNPVASVNTIYTWGKYLKDAGYKPIILHEKKEYTKPEMWMGSTEYTELEHKSADAKDINMFPQDFLIIPEIYSNVMESTKTMPVKRVVLCQSYDYILEFIKPGEQWLNYNINECITTCESQKKYLQYIFPQVKVDVVPISIPEYFVDSDKPKKPIFAIHTRDPRNAMKIMKTFFLRFPQYRWITFRDMRGMKREDFAKGLKECCIAIWDDKQSGFGTFPIEAFKSNTTLIATRPTVIPDWYDEKSAVWVNDTIDIADAIGKTFSAWLEDLLPEELLTTPEKYTEMYKPDQEKDAVIDYFDNLVQSRIGEFEDTIKEIESQVKTQTPNNPEIINLFE
jgi:hypothetical protein